jgi:hypothetical protein
VQRVAGRDRLITPAATRAENNQDGEPATADSGAIADRTGSINRDVGPRACYNVTFPANSKSLDNCLQRPLDGRTGGVDQDDPSCLDVTIVGGDMQAIPVNSSEHEQRSPFLLLCRRRLTLTLQQLLPVTRRLDDISTGSENVQRPAR